MPRKPSGRRYRILKSRTFQIKEVYSLEEILEVNLGCKNPFKNNGELSAWGDAGYELLVQIIFNLANIGVCRPSESAKLVHRLEMIKNEPDMVIESLED